MLARKLVLAACFCTIVVYGDPEEPSDGRMSAFRCSRAKSREARTILNEEILPILIEKDYSFPGACPLNPNLDAYKKHEANKKEIRHSQWKCLFCSKIFKTEDFLDIHFDNRHSNELNPGTQVCLADYCEIFGCFDVPSSRRCNPKEMDRLNFDCHALMNKCFPPTASSTAVELHDLFARQFCERLRCSEDGSARDEWPTPKAPVTESKGLRKLYIVFGILGVIIMIMFYIGLFLYKREMSLVTDLRKLSSARRAARLAMLKQKAI
eukprot:CAMPEP_0175968046 /NCGR_PEP_ID=MMETSP0108-20121206/39664_1 /TAXON_ID=195067 ORGANISM="Goniomonas pacifica, Strain CCMP1869" /NCGR_SAMPLE_ID=MMETSP0108 /ASSEMBLY_ACC=CAM_ASM_000204 /LENGTH=265 /DNA_ID=CAMNT_0017296625 /DNA_START=10 /DNA_END=807 /DNA_ORIENTATION=-